MELVWIVHKVLHRIHFELLECGLEALEVDVRTTFGIFSLHIIECEGQF